jgi:hypothetical protein
VLIKVLNDGRVSQPLNIESPQAGPVYAGRGLVDSSNAKQQTALNANENTGNDPGRFLQVEMFSSLAMTERSERVVQSNTHWHCLYSSESGPARGLPIGFNVGQGTQDLGFRARTAVLFQRRAGDCL